MSPAKRSGAAVARDWIRAIEITQRLQAGSEPTLAAVVEAQAAAQGDAPALIGAAGTLSYAALADRCDRISRWGLAQGLLPGDVVGLLMLNQPDYVAIWLGLSRIGCVVALLNTNLRGDALAHCLRSAAARQVIVDAALVAPAGAIMPAFPDTKWWARGDDTAGMLRFDPASQAPGLLTPGEHRPPAARDPALLIYSSGTTGLPKATYITHGRIVEWAGWFAGLMDAVPGDRLYDCLPLYHSTGGVTAVGAMLVGGGGVIIRERFSASRFWEDVTASGATIFQYIGELCRYLLQATPAGAGHGHTLRLCCGNGLRGDVWSAFQERFAIPRILEFYAATEGLLSLYNCEGQPGAIGRIPPFLAHRFPLELVRCDAETGEPLRDAAGRCLRCDPDEPGEAIARLSDAPRIYTDGAASARKVLQDVFEPGDRWFRSGDLLRRGKTGFFSFVDRLGDTFRWKGENVSTTEVGAILLGFPGINDAVVYGVALPGAEGKAGMAALSVDEPFDWAGFHAHCAAHLPNYARPMFVRLTPIATTGTFKHNKVTLAREGYGDVGDPIWFDDRTAFVPLDAALRGRIEAGQVAR